MLYATSHQAPQLMLMLMTGMLMAAVGLIFRGIRTLICAGTWLSLICDILMGTVWGIVFCLGLLTADMGRLRIFHLISAALGAALFHAACCLPACRFVHACTNVLCRLCSTFAKSKAVRMLLR